MTFIERMIELYQRTGITDPTVHARITGASLSHARKSMPWIVAHIARVLSPPI